MIYEAKHLLDINNVKLSDDLFTSVYKGPANFFKVNRLEESTNYAFRISATNETGQGAWSNILTFKTARSPPIITKSSAFFRFILTIYFKG